MSTKTASQAWLFHGLHPLHVFIYLDCFTVSTLCTYWSRQPRVFRHLTSLLSEIFSLVPHHSYFTCLLGYFLVYSNDVPKGPIAGHGVKVAVEPVRLSGLLFLAATKQLYKWYFTSVRMSVTPFWLCSHHRIIMKFSGVITNDQSKVHAKGQGQKSKVKVTEVTAQLNRFRTVTPVWIHIWWWNDAYSLMLLRRGALLFFKVIRQISRSHGSKNLRIWPRLGVSGL